MSEFCPHKDGAPCDQCIAGTGPVEEQVRLDLVTEAYQRGRDDFRRECVEALKARNQAVGSWRVRFSNYYPEEIDSTWETQAEAETRCDGLNEDGDGMWVVEGGFGSSKIAALIAEMEAGTFPPAKGGGK